MLDVLRLIQAPRNDMIKRTRCLQNLIVEPLPGFLFNIMFHVLVYIYIIDVYKYDISCFMFHTWSKTYNETMFLLRASPSAAETTGTGKKNNHEVNSTFAAITPASR